MELQITTLIENEPDTAGKLQYEHGLSMYIEFDGKKLLFDTGQTGAFVENANILSKDLGSLDYVFVSHGHYDHSGGMKRLLPLLSKDTVVCVGEEFFHGKYKKAEDAFVYNGVDFSEQDLLAQGICVSKVVDDTQYLTDKIIVFKNFLSKNDFEMPNPKFYKKTDTGMQPDAFADEIALGLVTEKGLVVLVGCSHPGIVTMLQHIKERVDMPLYCVIGGTHLVDAFETRFAKTVEAMRAMHLQKIAVSHCTGEAGKAYMREAFAEDFVHNNTGNVFVV